MDDSGVINWTVVGRTELSWQYLRRSTASLSPWSSCSVYSTIPSRGSICDSWCLFGTLCAWQSAIHLLALVYRSALTCRGRRDSDTQQCQQQQQRWWSHSDVTWHRATSRLHVAQNSPIVSSWRPALHVVSSALRGGATILKVRGTKRDLRAKRTKKKILYPHIWKSGGYNFFPRGRYEQANNYQYWLHWNLLSGCCINKSVIGL